MKSSGRFDSSSAVGSEISRHQSGSEAVMDLVGMVRELWKVIEVEPVFRQRNHFRGFADLSEWEKVKTIISGSLGEPCCRGEELCWNCSRCLVKMCQAKYRGKLASQVDFRSF